MPIDETDVLSPYLKTVSPLRSSLERRVMQTVSTSFERVSWAQCRHIGSYLGLSFYAAGGRRRKLAIDNIQQALGVGPAQAMRIARRSAQNWGMTTCEFLHLPNASAQDIREYVSLSGLEHLRNVLAEGKGAILLMAHLGEWEALVARIAQECDLAGIVRPLSNGTMHEHMSSVRRSIGLSLISKHAAARPALKHLRKGGALCILPDRHAGPDGILLPLFGRPTSFEASPARLAVMSGAPIIPTFGIRRTPWLLNGKIDGRILPPIHVQQGKHAERETAVIEGTKAVIHSLETIVRAHPDQWSWMLRRWRAEDLFSPAFPSTTDILPRRGRSRRGSGVSSWIHPGFSSVIDGTSQS